MGGILKEIVDDILNKNKIYVILNDVPIIEMARINTKEFYGYFPYNKFEIRIWSNDHNPPHFHVMSNGWNVVVDIITGEVIRVEQSNTKESQTFSYIKEYIKKWLDDPNAKNKAITNRENALDVWEMNNENKMLDNEGN